MNEQHVAAFINALVAEDVSIVQLEGAIGELEQRLRWGESIGKFATKTWGRPPDYSEAAMTALAYQFCDRIAGANR